jgi:hypothetical protein
VLGRINNDIGLPSPKVLETEDLNLRNKIWVNTQQTIEDVGVEEDRIANDRYKSEEGKREALAAFATKVASNKFAYLGNALMKSKESEEGLTNTLLGAITKRPTGDPVVLYSREKEIRDQVRLLDINQRNSHYLKRLEADDLETIRALLDCPGGSMVDQEVRERAEDAYALRTNPDKYRKLKSVQLFQEHLRSLAVQVSMWLRDLGGDEQVVNEALGLV